MSNNQENAGTIHEELSQEHHDPLIRGLHGLIRICVKLLAVLMAIVILMGHLTFFGAADLWAG